MKYFFVLLVSLLPLSFAQTLNVFAASSLTDAFEEIATAFENANPNVDVVLNFAGSSTLATQITQGAPADVFASADTLNIQPILAVKANETEPVVFARNRLTVITPRDSDIRTLEDLAKPGVLLVLANADVPAGAYSRQVLENLKAPYGEGFAASVLGNVVSEEPNVRQVATKVELGEADAGIVYTTDAALLQNIRTIEIPAEHSVTAAYPIAVIKSIRSETAAIEKARVEGAQAFIEFVLSEEGQKILSNYGFLPRE